MKSLFAILSLVGSFSFAASVEPGLYKAKDVDTGTIEATLDVKANNTVSFTMTAPDFEMPEPGCHGTYTITGTLLTADMKCPTLDMLPEVVVTIDIATVTPQSVSQEPGALVSVVIDAVGPDVTKFYLRKVK